MLYGRELVTGDELILFTRITKTGGSSLRRSLRQLTGTKRYQSKGKLWKRPENMEPGICAEIRLIEGHFDYGRHVHFSRRPLYVTIVRDPIKRFFSWYHYVQRLPDHPRHEKISGRSMEDALAIAIELEWPGTHDDQCSRLSLKRSFAAAKDAVDSNYFLAATTEQLSEAHAAIWRAYAPDREILELQRRKARPPHEPDVLTPALQRMLESTSPNDFLLHEYVKEQFADLVRNIMPAVRVIGYNPVVKMLKADSAATQAA
jgi:hypothetical protein